MLEHPFHEGELLVQQRVGETIAAQQNGRIIADTILSGALKFIEQQPMAILGSVDGSQVWASVLFGNRGFIKPLDAQTIAIDLTQASFHRCDPVWTIRPGSLVGMLVIELASRRRLRINGTIAQITPEQLRLHVLESYPNCPKYIQRRQLAVKVREISHPIAARSGQALTFEQQTRITAADTLFVASAHPTRGVDASHRGGNPGFVQILDDRTLRIPDYAGNSMFNTLGNLVVNPHAGLLFLDFDGQSPVVSGMPQAIDHRSRTLQLTGQATIQWQIDDAQPTGGTHRYWDFAIEQWLETELPQTLQTEFFDYSPHNPIA